MTLTLTHSINNPLSYPCFHREMLAAFHAAGLEAWDVNMYDSHPLTLPHPTYHLLAPFSHPFPHALVNIFAYPLTHPHTRPCQSSLTFSIPLITPPLFLSGTTCLTIVSRSFSLYHISSHASPPMTPSQSRSSPPPLSSPSGTICSTVASRWSALGGWCSVEASAMLT